MSIEKLPIPSDNTLSINGRTALAEELGCNVSDLYITSVSGGYSRNRRSLVKYGDEWIFAKEVDLDLLPSDGKEELAWLRKDYECTEWLRTVAPSVVPEWGNLIADSHILLMPSFRKEDGWTWTVPSTANECRTYIQAVVDTTQYLDTIQCDEAVINRLHFQPYLRDMLGLDDGIQLIRHSDAARTQLEEKYVSMSQDESLLHLREAIDAMRKLLADDQALGELEVHARALLNQPNQVFGHCDVRSDNIAYNQHTGEIKLVDWNWASMTPTKFGATEFLTDMEQQGIDVTEWLDSVNVDLLAASVGFYAKRALQEPLAPGSILREMQARSAAAAYNLYRKALLM